MILDLIIFKNKFMLIIQFKFSIIIAVEPPPPLHIVAIPNLPLFYLKKYYILIRKSNKSYFKTLINDKTILAPDIPTG